MRKEERILREILTSVIDKKEVLFQKGLSKTCNVSLGLVNHLVNILQEQSSIQKRTKGFSVTDPSKILLYWATRRNIKRDIQEKYYIKKSVTEIEKTLPSSVSFTAYSGWRLSTNRVPADYREVVIYVPIKKKDSINLWLTENKPAKGPENLFIIYIDDEHLLKSSKKNVVPISQIFVDIYSLGGISSKYFLNDILEKYPELKFEV